MRRPATIRHVIGLALVLLALIPAVALARASMSAPSTAAVGSRVTIRASGLKPGHYTLALAIEVLPGGAAPTNCVGNVGSATAHNGRVTISGALPTRLGCYMGVGAVEGHKTAGPGSYDLTLGVEFHPNGFSLKGSFVIRKIHLTS